MNSFNPLKNRDASHIIKGYVYQIDITIKRWLNLKQNEILMLECGEDIDKISGSVLDGSIENYRILEQIKHRKSSISLKSDEVKVAIVNFISHRLNNPECRLYYKYTTNSNITYEKPPIIPGKEAGIRIWQHMHENRQVVDSDEYINSIHLLLKSYTKPSGFNEEIWSKYYNFIQNADSSEIASIVKAFEIVDDFTDADSIITELKEEIINFGYAANEIEAQKIYEHLFYYTIRLLTKKNDKKLTYTMLKEVLEKVISQEEIETIQKLQNLINSLHHETIEHIDNGFQRMDSKFDFRFDKIMEKLTKTEKPPNLKQDVQVKEDYNDIINLRPPPLIRKNSKRESLVKMMLTNFENHTWLAIQGGSGTGKTQLAVLITKQVKHSYWVSFQKFYCSEIEIQKYFYNVLRKISRSNETDFYQLCELSCKEAGKNTLFILDNLPKIEINSELSKNLYDFSYMCKKHNIYLLSSSVYELPDQMFEYFEENMIKQVKIPMLSEGETREILEAYGCIPSAPNGNFFSMVNLFTQGHPTFVTAFAMYSSKKNWDSEAKFFNSLLTKDYIADVTDSIFRVLAKTLSTESKELLYRLSLCDLPFSHKMAKKISTICPSITRFRESLIPLDELWIQRESNDQYLISPLVKNIGITELMKDTLEEVHRVIGSWIINKKVISEAELGSAIIHFFEARDYISFGYLLTKRLSELVIEKIDNSYLLILFDHMTLPEEMALGQRILIRSFQFILRSRANRDVEYLLNDIESLCADANIDEMISVVGIFININKINRQYHKRIINLLFKLLKKINNEPMSHQANLILSKYAIGSIIWLSAISINDESDILHWLNLIEQLDHSQFKQACNDKILTDITCSKIVSTLWLPESNKSPENQNWNVVIDKIITVGSKAKQINFNLLWAYTVEAQLIIQGEYLNDIAKCEEIFNLALKHISNYSQLQFILHQSIGLQFFRIENYNESLKYFLKALKFIHNDYFFNSVETAIRASVCYSKIGENNKKVIEYCQLAVTFAENQETITKSIDLSQGFADAPLFQPFVIIQALGELAIAQYYNKNLVEAFNAIDRAAKILLSRKQQDEIWKSNFVLLGHISGYVSSIAINNKEPESITNGEEYIEPKQGCMLNYDKRLPQYFDKNKIVILLQQFACFADAIGKDEEASFWYNSAIRTSNELSIEILPFLAFEFIRFSQLTIEGFYEQSFVLVFELFSKIIQISIQKSHTDPDVLRVSEENTFQLWSFIIVIRICLLAINNKNKAVSEANIVKKVCTKLKNQSNHKELWEEYELLLSNFINSPENGKALIEEGSKKGGTIIRPLYYLLSTVTNITIVESLQLHLMVFPILDNLLIKTNSCLYRKLILPFVEKYWEDKITKSRCVLRNPSIVEQSFAEAKKSPTEQRLKKILKSVLVGFKIELSQQIRDWLSSC